MLIFCLLCICSIFQLHSINKTKSPAFIWIKSSALEVELKADEEFDHYRKRQDREYISDFYREVKCVQGKQLE